MTAPGRLPLFFDSFTGRDTPHPAALREPGYLLDALANDARAWPDWRLDDASQRPIRLIVAEHVAEQRLVIEFAVGESSGTITAVPDASGYLRIVVAAAGVESLTGYVERIWEEHEIWPPGAIAAVDEEPPGILGKHRSWVSISAAGWPQLRAIANENGWLNLMQIELPASE